MKKFLRKTIIAGLAGMITISACNKDFLDTEAPGGLAPNEFYKTDADADMAVVAVYDMMQAHYNTDWASLYMVKTMLSDESNAGGSGEGDQPGYQALDDFKHDPENDMVRKTWSILYSTIFRANLVINNTDASNNVRKRIVAEAKALRAYNYFDLVSLWGDVPLITTQLQPTELTSVTRTPKAQVYAQIVKDLTEAIPDLPLKSQYGANDKFRISKGTAQAILGKVYLYQEQWEDAAEQFDAVVLSNEYGLESSVGRTFSRFGEFGTESIFEISFTSTEAYTWGNFPWGGQPESNIHQQLMGPRSDYYKKATADSLIGGWGFNTAKKKVYDAFVAAGDMGERKQATIMSEAELRAGGGDWTTTTAWDYEGYFQRKYGSYSTQTNSANGATTELNYGTNFRLIRYADVLLLGAEAHYRNNNEGKAREYLKLVRERSELPEINPAGNALFQAIVNERFLELAFEGHRFQDLVRWGMAPAVLGPLGFVTGKHELLPIPGNDVRSAGLTQNPKYN